VGGRRLAEIREDPPPARVSKEVSTIQASWPQLLLERTTRAASRAAEQAAAERNTERLAEDHETFAVDLAWVEQAALGLPSPAREELLPLVRDLGDVRVAT
jgi:hypothetical protein